MPRARKDKGNPRQRTATGYPAQRVESVPGQRYGEGKQQQELQRAMPAPQVIQPAGTASATGRSVTQRERTRHPPMPAGYVPGEPPRAIVDPMQIAAQMRGQANLLTQPTMRPNEPITAGLSSGPGPGPEALTMRRGSPTAKVLADLARLTGDSYLAELVNRSRP